MENYNPANNFQGSDSLKTTKQNFPSTSSSNRERAKSSAPSTFSGAQSFKKNLQEKLSFKRSQLVKEFGTENKHGHLNCFLNVCLQALWQFPKVRAEIQMMLTTRDADGCAQIKDFVNSVQDFYEGLMFLNQEFTQEVPVLPALKVRAELFKLYYSQNEFVLHEKADAFEAFDQILGILHSWSVSLENPARKKWTLNQCLDIGCENESACMIHQNFCQQTITQQKCTCGLNSENDYQSKNLFGITVNTVEILKLLAGMKGKSSNYSLNVEESKLIATHEVLIKALKFLMERESQSCIDDPKKNHHNTKNIIHLMYSPEVFTFNVVWDGEPLPSKILNFMVSIPERFNSKQLFDTSEYKPESYVLRGIICFQSAHYLAFFRKIVMKKEYLTDDFQNREKIFDQLETEVAQNNEWTMFDDSNIDNKGNWFEVVKQCVELRTYPTVLFYEKIDSNEGEPKVISKLSSKEIVTLHATSKFQDNEFADFGGGFSQADILQQIELEQAIKKNKSANNHEPQKVQLEEHKVPTSLSKSNTTTNSQSDQKQLTLLELKKKYKEFGVYLFPCNRCSEGLHALHIEKCLNPECGSVNFFQEKGLCTNHKMWMQCLLQILKLKGWMQVSVQNQVQQTQINNSQHIQTNEEVKNQQNPNQSQIYQAQDSSFTHESRLNQTEVNIQVDRNPFQSYQLESQNKNQKTELEKSGRHNPSMQIPAPAYSQGQNQVKVPVDAPQIVSNQQQEEAKYPDLNCIPPTDQNSHVQLQYSQQQIQQYVTPGGPQQYFQSNMQQLNQNLIFPQNQAQEIPLDQSKHQFMQQFSPRMQQVAQNQRAPGINYQASQVGNNYYFANQVNNFNGHLPNKIALDDEEFIFDAEPLQHQQIQQPSKSQSNSAQQDIKQPTQAEVQDQKLSQKIDRNKSNPIEKEEVMLKKHQIVKPVSETNDEDANLNFEDLDEKQELYLKHITTKDSKLQGRQAGETIFIEKTVDDRSSPFLFNGSSNGDQQKKSNPDKSQLQSINDEMITVWKCPKCKVLVGMGEPNCEKCQLTLYEYEVKGYALENIILEVPVSKLYEQIQIQSEKVVQPKVSQSLIYSQQQKEETKQSIQEQPVRSTKVQTLKFTVPHKLKEHHNSLNTDIEKQKSNSTVIDIVAASKGAKMVVKDVEAKSSGSWQCQICQKINDTMTDECYHCKRSVFTDKEKPLESQTKINQDSRKWQCKICDYNSNYYFEKSCYNCKKPQVQESIDNQNKVSQVQSVLTHKNCTHCGERTLSTTVDICKNCQMNQAGVQKMCIDCKKQEKFKHYDKCTACRLKDVESDEQKDKMRRLTCGTCGKLKERESMKVCGTCQQKAESIKSALHTEACMKCFTKSRHREFSLCYDCHKEVENLKCNKCKREKESQHKEFCDRCTLANLEQQLKYSKMCTVCKEKERYAHEQTCLSCINKKKPSMCKACHIYKADNNSQICARCKYEEKKSENKNCDRCNKEFFGIGMYCQECIAHDQTMQEIKNSAPEGKKICKCEKEYVINGGKLGEKCLAEFQIELSYRNSASKQPKQGRPETGKSTLNIASKSSNSKPQKNLKCPRCRMEMQNFSLDVVNQLKCPHCKRKFTSDQLYEFNTSAK